MQLIKNLLIQKKWHKLCCIMQNMSSNDRLKYLNNKKNIFISYIEILINSYEYKIDDNNDDDDTDNTDTVNNEQLLLLDNSSVISDSRINHVSPVSPVSPKV